MQRALKFLIFLILLGAGAVTAQAACMGGACVSAGPRLASVDSSRSAEMNAVFSQLTGSNLNLTVADWNALAQGGTNMGMFLDALAAEMGVAGREDALAGNATLSQIFSAMATAAREEGNAALAASLDNLKTQFADVAGTVQAADFLDVGQDAQALDAVQFGSLDLVTGIVQLYNYDRISAAREPVTLTGDALDVGDAVQVVRVSVQVTEPPVARCGPAGTTFHSAAMRFKFEVDLAPLSPDVSALNQAGVSETSVTLSSLEFYAEVARGSGIVDSVDALRNTVTVTATPGVADLYLGTVSDAVFYNRAATINPDTDLDFARIGSLTTTDTVTGTSTTVDIEAKSHAHGSTTPSTLFFTGPYPQTLTAGTGSGFAANMASDLANNMSLRLSPDTGAADAATLSALTPIVQEAMAPVLDTMTTQVVAPVLQAFGVGMGEMDVTVDGLTLVCPISGYVYHDTNHNAQRETPETGPALALYAKLISAVDGAATQVAAVDAATGSYTFTAVPAGSYQVIIDDNTDTADTASATPAGWIGTEAPDMIRALTVAGEEISEQNFGLFFGSRISGKVFRDDGVGGGAPNNGVKDGTEAALAGVAITLADAGGIQLDSTATDGDGGYVLWVSGNAGAESLNVTERNPVAYLSIGGSAGDTGGSYDRAADTTIFSFAGGRRFQGVDFADVSVNRFDTDGARSALPGTVVFYPHTFVAGSGGEVAFNTASSAAPDTGGWNVVLYRDTDCNGVLSSGEALLANPLTVTASGKICVLAKVFVPASAPYGARHSHDLSAVFNYTNASPSLDATLVRTDQTLAGGNDAGLMLTKRVDKTAARPGENITYTIAYANTGSEAIKGLRIRDATPAYTTFNSAVCGTLPPDFTACTVAVQPAVGAEGTIVWEFTGPLAPGASGTVSFDVTLE
ncbi:hypothetical protein CAP31_12440 [Sulfuriferula sp. AH1]|nr:hypothetical protein CAP31_12440 [Sulfuriferula sp. AH1]